jgi:tetratricopeptide (TPR) repeat protein
MSSSNDKRVNEARECIERAEKHLKTSIFKLKTKPDYDLACSEYERAATCFKNAGDLDQSIEMYLKSADCHKNSGNRFHEAKYVLLYLFVFIHFSMFRSKELAAMVAKDKGDLNKATALFEEAANLYLESNSQDSSVMTIDKAGKLLEPIDTKKAIEVSFLQITFNQCSLDLNITRCLVVHKRTRDILLGR